jgi:hypothetical protein
MMLGFVGHVVRGNFILTLNLWNLSTRESWDNLTWAVVWRID